MLSTSMKLQVQYNVACVPAKGKGIRDWMDGYGRRLRGSLQKMKSIVGRPYNTTALFFSGDKVFCAEIRYNSIIFHNLTGK